MQTLFRSALPLLLVSLFTFTGLSMTPEAAGAAAPAASGVIERPVKVNNETSNRGSALRNSVCMRYSS